MRHALLGGEKNCSLIIHKEKKFLTKNPAKNMILSHFSFPTTTVFSRKPL
jgi:hypothetical protein